MKNNKILRMIFTLFLALMLSSCSLGAILPGESEDLNTNEEITEPSQPNNDYFPLEPSRTSEPTEIIADNDADKGLKYSCLEILDLEDDRKLPKGQLVLYDSIVDLETQEKMFLEDNWRTIGAAVSQDHSRLAIRDLNSDSVIIKDSEFNEIQTIPLEKYKNLVPRYWLDQNTLILHESNPTFGPTSVYIMDINSSKIEPISPWFEDLNSIRDGIGYYWGAFGYETRLSVNPHQSHLVYPSLTQELVLWDLGANKEVGRFLTRDLATFPWWTPDGQDFITALPINLLHEEDNQNSNEGWEIVRIDLQGRVSRLSFLTEKNPVIEYNYVWSPDYSKVAFTLDFLDDGDIPDPNMPNDLAVLDIDSGSVTNFCLKSIGYPVWSPDGNYLAVFASQETNPKRIDITEVFLVNLNTAEAFVIADNEKGEPFGWLVP